MNPPEPPLPPGQNSPAAGHNVREVDRQVAVADTLTETKLRNIQISGKTIRRVGIAPPDVHAPKPKPC
jgi:hypothetical protein